MKYACNYLACRLIMRELVVCLRVSGDRSSMASLPRRGVSPGQQSVFLLVLLEVLLAQDTKKIPYLNKSDDLALRYSLLLFHSMQLSLSLRFSSSYAVVHKMFGIGKACKTNIRKIMRRDYLERYKSSLVEN